MESATQLKRTSLYDHHLAADAKMVDFAGWEMPVEYSGVKSEHINVRQSCGVFDVSHMGQIFVRGEDAEALLQRVFSNDISALKIGCAQYSVICNPDGGVIDDVFTYRLEKNLFLVITNASNHYKDLAWIREHAAGLIVSVDDQIDDFAMLAVQGPRARDIVQTLVDHPLPDRFQIRPRTIHGFQTLVAGTGYTGEDGVEILMAPEAAGEIWDLLLARGVTPAGLGARDTLRLEACYHLYGNDLSDDRDPIGAGLGWACKEETGFIGSDKTAEVRKQGPSEKLVAFAIEGKGIARQGNPVVGGGEVTSGTFSPMLDQGIGMAYLPAEMATPGTQFQIDVRGRVRDAIVVDKPIYKRPDAN